MSVTSLVSGRVNGAPRLVVASLVVTRGGEFDRVIAAIVALPCADVAFAPGDGYRLDPLHDVREERLPVYVNAGGRAYQVWVRRRADLATGYAVEQVSWQEGKVLAPVCERAAPRG